MLDEAENYNMNYYFMYNGIVTPVSLIITARLLLLLSLAFAYLVNLFPNQHHWRRFPRRREYDALLREREVAVEVVPIPALRVTPLQPREPPHQPSTCKRGLQRGLSRAGAYQIRVGEQVSFRMGHHARNAWEGEIGLADECARNACDRLMHLSAGDR
jgi:hypothetical protein